MASNQLVHSIRIMKKIMRRVDSCWTKEKLLGEVDLDTLLLTFTLRESEPDLFNAFINIYPDLFYPLMHYKKMQGVKILKSLFQNVLLKKLKTSLKNQINLKVFI